MTTYPTRHIDLLRSIPEGTFTAAQIGARHYPQFLKSLRCKGFVEKAGKVRDFKGSYVNSWRATSKFWTFRDKHFPLLPDAVQRLKCQGEKNPSSKLTEAQAKEIKQRWKKHRNCRQIGREFGICPDQVWRIGTGRSWSHLGDA